MLKEKSCQNCGNSIELYQSEIDLGKGKYCSRECKVESMKVLNEYTEKEGHVVLTIERKGELYDCLIDKDDEEKVSQYQWHLTDKGYAASSDLRREKDVWAMHRLIMDFPDELEVDHINRNTLDNRKENLRLVTHKQQGRNRKPNKNSSCEQQSGVSWDESCERWRCEIWIDGQRKHLGYFEDVDEAIEVRKEAEKKYFGEYAPSVNPNNRSTDNKNT